MTNKKPYAAGYTGFWIGFLIWFFDAEQHQFC
jgi:hypothetical protein